MNTQECKHEWLCWDDGFVCTHCGARRYYVYDERGYVETFFIINPDGKIYDEFTGEEVIQQK